METAVRFAPEGALVAIFTVVGNLFPPKNFSAPSVALARLVIAPIR